MKRSLFVLQVSSIVHSLRTLTTVPRSQYSILNEATRSNTQEMVVSERGSSFNNIIQGAKWIDLQIPASELRPNYTLIMGQCFNWKRIDDSDVDGVISSCWVGILGSHPLAIRQTGDSTYFANLLEIGGSKFAASKVSSVKSEHVKSENVKSENGGSGTSNAELAQMLHTYFQIDHSLEDLYLDWAKGCDRMKVVTDTLKGVRVVRQDPFECLISFICSSNNNIKRIALMLDRLRCRYGQYICTVQYCKSTDNISAGSGSSSGAWQVFVIDYAEEVAREELTGSSLRSPTPSKAVRKSTASPKTPSDEPILPLKYHIFEFPSIAALSQATEAELRALGMGYRAKFISGSAQFLSVQEGGGAQWLAALRDMSANLVATKSVKIKAERVSIKEERTVKTKVSVISEINVNSKSAAAVGTVASVAVAAGAVDSDSDIAKTLSRLRVQSQLMLMPGVGRKVADCVALFSLDQTEGIPVDTHVWDIALRDYDPLLTLKRAKSITPAIYEEVGEVFRKRFPCKAGWAHSVLFAAELPEFRVRLPIALQEEMKAFTEHSKSVKKIGNAAKLDRKKDALRGKDSDDDLDDEVDDDDEEDETPLKRSVQKKRKISEPSPPVVKIKAEAKAKVEAKVKVKTPKKS